MDPHANKWGHCPVCVPWVILTSVGSDGDAPLRRCLNCRGIWANAKALKSAPDAYSKNHPVMLLTPPSRCRRCGQLLGGKQFCSCSSGASLRCPTCRTPLEAVQFEGITVDVCRPCRAGWFDSGEFGAVVRLGETGRLVGNEQVASVFGQIAGEVVVEGVIQGAIEVIIGGLLDGL